MRSAEEYLQIEFNKPEWKMADYPFGDNKEAVLAAIREAQREAIKEAAESADLRDGCYDEGCHCNSEPKKQSILSLLNQIQ